MGPEFLGTLDLFRSSVMWKGAGLPGVKLPRAKEKHLVSPWRLESSLRQNRIQNGRRETPWFGGKRRPTKESRGSRRCHSERACFWPHAGAWFKVKLPGRHLPLLHGSATAAVMVWVLASPVGRWLRGFAAASPQLSVLCRSKGWHNLSQLNMCFVQ